MSEPEALYFSRELFESAVEKLMNPDWEQRARQAKDELALYNYLTGGVPSDDERQHPAGRPAEGVREGDEAILAQAHLLADQG